MGFHSECHFKFKENPEDPNSMFSKFNYFFNNLPLAAVLEKRFFCCHGGLGPYMMKNFAELKKIQRPIELPPPDRQNLSQSLLNEILWCDPAENESDLGFTSNDVRGGNGIQYFGKDVLAKFLDDNNFQMFIRAHQVVEKGFEEFHGGLGITVFSATNYCGLQGNSGAILIFSATESKFSIVPRMITPQVRHPDKQWDSEVNKKHPESPYSLKHSGYRKDLMPSAQLSQYTQ